MKPAWCLWLCLWPLFSVAQLDYKPYEFPTVVPQKYVWDAKRVYEEMIANPDTGCKKRDYRLYSETMSYGKRDLFLYGQVYLSWDELEDYLNLVLKRILPDSLKNRSDIRVYPARDPEYNAFAIHDGSLFFNVGLMAELKSEAALAIVLGHELAHYLYRDARDSYIKKLKQYTRRNRNSNLALRIENAVYDRAREHRADSIGLLLAHSAGYELTEGKSVLYLLMLEEQRIRDMDVFKKNELKPKKGTVKKKKEGAEKKGDPKKKKEEEEEKEAVTIESLLASHPETKSRIDFLDKMNAGLTDSTSPGKKFVVDESAFNRLRLKVRLESLNILLLENNFSRCVERAFTYYLFDPDHPDIPYFILEGIRRASFIDDKMKKKYFLTQDYQKTFKKKGILHDLTFLIRDTSLMSQIKAKELLDPAVIEFNTYDEAFHYFSKIAQKLSNNEAYLSMALYNYTKAALRDSLLNMYLDTRKPRYREYAEAILAKNLNKSTGDEELVLMDDISFIEDHSYGYHKRLVLAETLIPKYMEALTPFLKSHFPKKNVVNIRELSLTNLQKAMKYKQLLIASALLVDQEIKTKKKKSSKFKGVELFMVSPEFWYVFKEEGLKSVEFLRVTALDDRTGLVGALKYLIPWMAFYDLMNNYTTGSQRYAFEVIYYAYIPTHKEPAFLFSETVRYKMTTMHFLNEIYYAFRYRQRHEGKP